MAKNSNLTRAKNAKNDEFYTGLVDIENELKYYRAHFENKVVYCNCDDPTSSNFWRYFYRSFDFLGLKKLISTHFNMDGSPSYALIYEGEYDNAATFDEGVTKVPFQGDGDFRSDECVEYLKQSDIVVTNEPFSLFREYVQQLFEYNKQFLIIGNYNALTYKEVFPRIMHNQMWMGVNAVNEFKQTDGSIKKFGNVGWYTNLSVVKPTDQMTLFRHFDVDAYPVYDNYPAFCVSRVDRIPVDDEITVDILSADLKQWQSVYGSDVTVITQSNDKSHMTIKIKRPYWTVPITFMTKWNPTSKLQRHNLAKDFDIIGEANHGSDSDFDLFKPVLNGKDKFKRLVIRHK